MQTETKYMWEETSHLEPLSVKILQWRMEELENSRITKEWKVEEDSEQMEVKYIFQSIRTSWTNAQGPYLLTRSRSSWLRL